MKGGLRWPLRPRQVHCVLVAIWLIAAFSPQSAFNGGAGWSPYGLDPGCPVGRLNARTVAIAPGNSSFTDLNTNSDVSVASADAERFRVPRTFRPRAGQTFTMSASSFDFNFGIVKF